MKTGLFLFTNYRNLIISSRPYDWTSLELVHFQDITLLHFSLTEFKTCYQLNRIIIVIMRFFNPISDFFPEMTDARCCHLAEKNVSISLNIVF